MLKDGGMGSGRWATSARAWTLGLTCASAACSSGTGAAAKTTIDAGHHATDASVSVTAPADSGQGMPPVAPPDGPASGTVSADGGTGIGDDADVALMADDGGADGGGRNAPVGGQCLLTGQACDVDGGTLICCTDKCLRNLCGGCVPEGQPTIPSYPCCNGLSGDSGTCGTSACVADGVTCGGDAGKPCCNDNCSNGVCGS